MTHYGTNAYITPNPRLGLKDLYRCTDDFKSTSIIALFYLRLHPSFKDSIGANPASTRRQNYVMLRLFLFGGREAKGRAPHTFGGLILDIKARPVTPPKSTNTAARLSYKSTYSLAIMLATYRYSEDPADKRGLTLNPGRTISPRRRQC